MPPYPHEHLLMGSWADTDRSTAPEEGAREDHRSIRKGASDTSTAGTEPCVVIRIR